MTSVWVENTLKNTHNPKLEWSIQRSHWARELAVGSSVVIVSHTKDGVEIETSSVVKVSANRVQTANGLSFSRRGVQVRCNKGQSGGHFLVAPEIAHLWRKI